MKIITAFKSAMLNSLKTWKGIVIVWFLSLLLVSIFAIPLKGALKSALGDSMITEKLVNGFNVEVFTDMGDSLNSLISYLKSGVLMILLAGFLLNTFFTGGFFDSLRQSALNNTPGEFFRASARNFWSFLVISVMICLIILVLVILVIVLPLLLIIQNDGSLLNVLIIIAPIFLILLALSILVADYARAWQVSSGSRCFKALAFGFRQTFRTFSSSLVLILIVLIIQLLYGWLVFSILSGLKPATGGGVILLFLLSQFMFLIRIMLKVFRYGCVTSLMEQNDLKSILIA